MPSSHFILCCPLLFLPSIFPRIRVFSNKSALRIRWPEYWSFSFNISASNEHPGLISFRMDWLDLTYQQRRHLESSSSSPQWFQLIPSRSKMNHLAKTFSNSWHVKVLKRKKKRKRERENFFKPQTFGMVSYIFSFLKNLRTTAQKTGIFPQWLHQFKFPPTMY